MKKKIIVIVLAVVLLLTLGGGVAYARTGQCQTGHKLIGVGYMGHSLGDLVPPPPSPPSYQENYWWDTFFIVTNPNCDSSLTIEWLTVTRQNGYLVKQEQVSKTLSPHEVWAIGLSEFLGPGEPPVDIYIPYTLEITWEGASYNHWFKPGWGNERPLIGWTKEKCWYWLRPAGEPDTMPPMMSPSLAISETPMVAFPGPDKAKGPKR